jgi:hypothetical protein
MRRAGSGKPPREDFAALGDELSQQSGVLVVCGVDPLLAELANLAAAEVLLAPSGTGAATFPAWPSFFLATWTG